MWKRLEYLKKEHKIVSAKVFEVTSLNGLIVDVGGTQGLVPSTEISSFYFKKPLKQLINKNIDLEIIIVDEYRHRLILSYSLPIKRERIKQLKTGQEITGAIRAIKPYGIFVDIQDIYGFIDKSKICSNSVEKLDSIFKVWQNITSTIINIDTEKYRVFLSI